MIPRKRVTTNSAFTSKTSGGISLPGTAYGPKSPTSPTQKTGDSVTSGTGGRKNSTDTERERRTVQKSESFVSSRNAFIQEESKTRRVQKSDSFAGTRRTSVTQNEDKDKRSRTSSTSSSESSVSNSAVPNPTVASGFKVQFTSPEQPGYVGFANLPNQVHRKSVKKGFEFTLMVVGESGLGKSTLVNSLFLTDLYPERHIHTAAEKIKQTVKIDASTVEIEERGVKLRLTVVDTPGFGDTLNSVDCFKPIIQYVDDQFERYLQDESGLNRRHIVDNRVHCCFYFINPSGHGLRPLDISFMKAVHHKVNIVPVIAKADTLTKPEVSKLKKKIMDEIAAQGISIYPLPDCDEDEDEDYREQCRLLKEAVPFAVIGANTVIEVKGRKVRGRMYPWGVVEVENPEHCDFIKLRTMLITHMQDLQEVTQEVHYENFRAEKLAGGTPLPKKARKPRAEETVNDFDDKRRPESQSQELSDRERQLQEKEAELKRMQDMLARMQAEMDQQKRGGTPQKMHQNGDVKSQNV